MEKEMKKEVQKETKNETQKEIKNEIQKEIQKETQRETREKTKDMVMEDTKEQKEQNCDQKKSSKKIIVLIFAVLILIALVAAGIYYFRGVKHYSTHFLPGTVIDNVDVSELEVAQVTAMLGGKYQDYSLEIVGRDYKTAESGTVLGTITASEIGLTHSVDVAAVVAGFLEAQNEYTWLGRASGDSKEMFTIPQGVSYDKALLTSAFKAWEASASENMIVPADAYISEYSESLGGYEIIPETIGTAFDVEHALELADKAILAQESSLDIEAAGCYEEPQVTGQDEKLVKAVDDANKMLNAQITYDWNGAKVVLDKEQLKTWVSVENNAAVLDEEAVRAFVKEHAQKNDTYGKSRNFMTTLGVELSLPSGYYGWLTDREAEAEELAKLIREGSVVSREPVYASKAKRKGMSDIGSSYVEADLTHQHLYLYIDGQIVFETDFVSGHMNSAPGAVTPPGVFGISYKTTNAVLRGSDYVTPVTYWMPFYNNYGMHDATWRTEFGGDIYITDGSHGCLNLPLESAAVLYQHVSAGFPVICYYYEVDPLASQEEEDDSDE